MKIGELAKAAKCSVETIRFYEKEGLLPRAGRGANNYRLYRAEHEERLRFIRNCRALDMSHEEVRTLLGQMDGGAADCGPVNAVLDGHIGHIDVRIRELEQLKAELTRIRKRCRSQSPVAECRIIEGISTMKPRKRAALTSH